MTFGTISMMLANIGRFGIPMRDLDYSDVVFPTVYRKTKYIRKVTSGMLAVFSSRGELISEY